MPREATTGRERILRAARSQFSDAGEQGFTMREVARRGGVTAAAIYHHFEGREELLGEVLRLGFEEFEAYLRRALEAGTPHERLLGTASAYIDFALDHPRDYEVMFMRPGVPGVRRYPEDFDAGESPGFQLVQGRVEECMEAGLLREEDPLRTTFLLWAAVHGLVSLRLAGRFPGPAERFRAVAMERMGRLVEALGCGTARGHGA